MNNEQEVVLIMIRGAIFGMPPETQVKVEECAIKMRSLVKEYGAPGEIAVALVGAELSARPDQ